MDLEAGIKRARRSPLTLWSCKLGGWNCTHPRIHFAGVSDQVGGGNWRPSSSRIAAAHGWCPSGHGSSGGRSIWSWIFIYLLTCNCGNVENWVQRWSMERLAGSGRQSISGWCSLQCTQYLVYTEVGVHYTRCKLLIMGWRDWEQWLIFVFRGDGGVEDKKEQDERRLG